MWCELFCFLVRMFWWCILLSFLTNLYSFQSTALVALAYIIAAIENEQAKKRKCNDK